MAKTKNERGHASVFDDDGADYRFISKMMSDAGWKMNHTSARNYILKIMSKFAEAYSAKVGKKLTPAQLSWVSRDPNFQSVVSELIQTLK
jgi:hypothetical protein